LRKNENENENEKGRAKSAGTFAPKCCARWAHRGHKSQGDSDRKNSHGAEGAIVHKLRLL
jgi:hypothetical protein